MSIAAEVLQAAFEADPCAIHSLIVNRVPCNAAMVNDPFVIVSQSPVLPDMFQVDALGLVNAVLAANGLPLVRPAYSDNSSENGCRRLVGFCDAEDK